MCNNFGNQNSQRLIQVTDVGLYKHLICNRPTYQQLLRYHCNIHAMWLLLYYYYCGISFF